MFPLKIAAKMREDAEFEYFQTEVEPLLGDGVEYVGELDEAGKFELLGAATALLNPIQWSEPFGLVMIEALACGTPVVATSAGSVPEIVDDGRTGFIRDAARGSRQMACSEPPTWTERTAVKWRRPGSARHAWSPITWTCTRS